MQAELAVHERAKSAALPVARSAREAREKRLALALLVPSVLIPMLLMLTFLFGIGMTFTQWRLTTGFVRFNGLDNYLEGLRRGRGVVFMTAHFGAWEMSSFAHALYGYPLKFVVRPIDNRRVEELVSSYRTLSGNVPIQRKQAARDILKALRQNEAVGILFDQNTTRSEGVFAEFFGIPAATTPSIALFALRAGAAVIPGFLIWDEKMKKHRLRLDPPVQLIETGDLSRDVLENTKKFNKILEGYVRKYPDQWLWIHRRWKTRPEGEPAIY